MQSVIAYLLAAWCYAVAIVVVMWIVPHVIRRFGLGFQVGVYLFALSLVIRGNEAWGVADGAAIADYWLFRNALAPAGATCMILGEYVRYATKRRKERLRRVKLLADGIGVCACPVQSVALSSRARRAEGEAGAIADQSGAAG